MNPDTARRAGFVVALSLLGAFAPHRAQAQVQHDAGRGYFQSGRALYDAGRYAEALEHFRASLDALPSPNTRLYHARCLRELGRLEEAHAQFSAASDEARARAASEPRYAQTADAATNEASGVAARLAFVVLDAGQLPPSSAVMVNGRVVDPSRYGSPIAVTPDAQFSVTVSAPGYQPFQSGSVLRPGQQARVDLRLAPLGTAPVAVSQPTISLMTGASGASRGGSPWRAVGVVAMATGGALGVAGLVTGLRASGLRSDLDAMCPQGCGPRPSNTVVSLVDEGRTMSLLTNVFLGAGGALVVFGAISFFASGGSSVEVYTPSLARVRPYLDPSRGTAGVVGAF